MSERDAYFRLSLSTLPGSAAAAAAAASSAARRDAFAAGLLLPGVHCSGEKNRSLSLPVGVAASLPLLLLLPPTSPAAPGDTAGDTVTATTCRVVHPPRTFLPVVLPPAPNADPAAP